jgi:serine/threonine protein kinase
VTDADPSEKPPLLDSVTKTLPRSLGSQASPVFNGGEVVAGRYRVVRLLGRGGMGVVYAVEDSELQADIVALKMVLPYAAQDEETLVRFRREIRLARKVTHPNACRVFDVGYHDLPDDPSVRILFVTMEYLGGDTLSDRIGRLGRLPAPSALPVFRQIVQGLGAIHDAGIVHRDFKSANVMFTNAGPEARAVITDFGIACLAERDGGGETPLTQKGIVLGSLGYISPEQLEGKQVGSGADIYALGVVMFETLTGRLPFEGETTMEAAFKRLREEPVRPSSIAPDLPPGWDRVILRCLARNPRERYAKVEQVYDDLLSNGEKANVLGNRDVHGLLRGRTRSAMWIAAGLVALAVASTEIYLNRHHDGAGHQKAQPAAEGRLDQISAGVAPHSRIDNRPADLSSLRDYFSKKSNRKAIALRTGQNKMVYVEGEPITYDVELRDAGYLYLFVFSPGGLATQVFPGPYDQDNRVSPGTIHLPRSTKYEFPVQPPFGEDLHVAVISANKLSLERKDAYTWSEILRSLDSVEQGVQTRGVGVRPAGMGWAAAAVVVESKRVG